MRGGIFTRDERAVVLFLAVSLGVGCLVLGARRVAPSAIPDFEPRDAAEETAPAREPEAWPVDVNAAGEDELVRLPGVGPVRAAAIVERRGRSGPFRSLEELLEIKGIGPATLERIRPLATTDPPREGVDGSAEPRSTTANDSLTGPDEGSH
jgi:competence protein ComEA